MASTEGARPPRDPEWLKKELRMIRAVTVTDSIPERLSLDSIKRDMSVPGAGIARAAAHLFLRVKGSQQGLAPDPEETRIRTLLASHILSRIEGEKQGFTVVKATNELRRAGHDWVRYLRPAEFMGFRKAAAFVARDILKNEDDPFQLEKFARAYGKFASGQGDFKPFAASEFLNAFLHMIAGEETHNDLRNAVERIHGQTVAGLLRLKQEYGKTGKSPDSDVFAQARIHELVLEDAWRDFVSGQARMVGVSGRSRRMPEVPRTKINWFEHYRKATGGRMNFSAALVRAAEKPFAMMVARYAKAGRVLDIGAGLGRTSMLLAERGFKVTALDNDDRVLNAARRNLESHRDRVEFVSADLTHLPKSIGRFGIVVHQNVLEHFEPDEVKEILRRQLELAPVVVFSVQVNPDTARRTPRDSLGRDIRSLRDWRHILGEFNILEMGRETARPENMLVAIARTEEKAPRK